MSNVDQTQRMGNGDVSTLPPSLRIARYDHYYDQRTFSYVLRKTNRSPKKHGKKNPILIVRRIINHKGQYERTEIDIKSRALCEILMEINEGVEGLNLLLSAPVCEPNLLFFSSARLRKRLEAEEEKNPRNDPLISDLHVALAFIEDDLAQTFNDHKAMLAGGSITFNLLWTLFAPNTLVFHHHHYTEQHRVLRVSRFKIAQRQDRSIYAAISCAAITNDGNSFGLSEEILEIDEFHGSRKILDLVVFPLEHHDDSQGIRQMAIERGMRYAGLEEHNYGEITGPGVREVPSVTSDQPVLHKFNTYGRIIVDPVAFRTFQPNCTFNFYVYKRLDQAHLTEEEYMICTPIVLGFCFGVKEWGGFALSRLEPIMWSERALDSLVLGTKQKQMIHSLVKQHDIRSSKFDDIIQGKGRGLIGLLAGPPGCGKTLTAEAMAEATKRPLYSVSAGELGTDPKSVDKALIQILDIAQRWRAVLLLDEADVFLFQRDDRDVVRNALVSIFLRQLEYYQGILFMTTNMIAHCDSAFESRIHFTVHYPTLDYAARRQIWKTFIDRSSGNETVGEAEMDAFAQHNLNGRQIKNTIGTANIIAQDEEKPLGAEHIQTVLDVSRDWHKARRTHTQLLLQMEPISPILADH